LLPQNRTRVLNEAWEEVFRRWYPDSSTTINERCRVTKPGNERSPGEPPSRWTVINDYSKTMVALNAALLGFIATFSDKLQVGQSSLSFQNTFLILAFLSLVVSIGCALLVPGQLDTYLGICAAGEPPTLPENPTQAERDAASNWNDRRPRALFLCKMWANFSMSALFCVGLCLALFACLRLTTQQQQPKLDKEAAQSEAIRFLTSFSGVAQPKWAIQSVTYIDKADTYEVVALEQATKKSIYSDCEALVESNIKSCPAPDTL
jgi:hypothetical protein